MEAAEAAVEGQNSSDESGSEDGEELEETESVFNSSLISHSLHLYSVGIKSYLVSLDLSDETMTSI